MSADPFSPADTDPCEPLEEDAVDAWLRGEWRPEASRPRLRLVCDDTWCAGHGKHAYDPKVCPLACWPPPRTWRSRLATRLEDLGGWCLRVLWDAAQAVRGE